MPACVALRVRRIERREHDACAAIHVVAERTDTRHRQHGAREQDRIIEDRQRRLASSLKAAPPDAADAIRCMVSADLSAWRSDTLERLSAWLQTWDATIH
jgi:hypothetical protein